MHDDCHRLNRRHRHRKRTLAQAYQERRQVTAYPEVQKRATLKCLRERTKSITVAFCQKETGIYEWSASRIRGGGFCGYRGRRCLSICPFASGAAQSRSSCASRLVHGRSGCRCRGVPLTDSIWLSASLMRQICSALHCHGITEPPRLRGFCLIAIRLFYWESYRRYRVPFDNLKGTWKIQVIFL